MGGIFERALDALYRTQIATSATFEGVAKTMRVIDKSMPEDNPTPALQRQGVKLPTVAPSVTIRNSEVVKNGLAVKDLIGKRVQFNGKTFYVHATKPVARPDGADETYLLIRGTR